MITTKRTLLRPIQKSDNEDIFSYRSDADTNKFQGWIPKTLAEVDNFINKKPNEFNIPGSWYQLVIEDSETKEILGDVGVHFIDPLQCEIGCTISKKHHQKGYATEALIALIGYLFHDLNKHRITASIDPENTDSIRLFEKLKFRKEAHFKQSLLLNGQWVDDVVYAVLSSEWQPI